MNKVIEKLKGRFGKPKFWDFLDDFLKRTKDDNVSATGAQLAYYLILSFFPFLIFLLTLVPYTPLANENVLSDLLAIMPATSRDLVQPILEDVLSQRSGTLLSVSLILALWSASSGMTNLLKAMDLAFDVENKRKAIFKRLVSLLFTLMLVVLILLAMTSQVFGQVIADALAETVFPGTLIRIVWSVVRTLLPFLLLTIGFALLYRFGPGFPDEQKLGLKEAMIGGVSAAVGWMLISFGFSFYVSNFANYANTYGSIGGLIVMLVWLYLSSVVIMLGGEITAAYISVFKKGITDKGGKVEPGGEPDQKT